MEKLFGFALFLLVCFSSSAQSSDVLASNEREMIVVLLNGPIAEVQVPSDTYMMEVIDTNGSVLFQKPTNDFTSINISSWHSGDYTVLAHTFNGLRQEEFRIN